MPQKNAPLRWSGYDWTVKSGDKLGPGPNRWKSENVRLDAQGRLHLTVGQDASGWACGEIACTRRFHFGLYEFHTVFPLERLDPNLVVGLFNYPPREVGPDQTNEIDIEWSRWGDPKFPAGNFTLWPGKVGAKSVSHTFEPPPGIVEATHRFWWLPDRIVWQCLRGHVRQQEQKGEFARWEFKPTADSGLIPQQPLPLLINFWLMRGRPPQNNSEETVIVSRFAYYSTKEIKSVPRQENTR